MHKKTCCPYEAKKIFQHVFELIVVTRIAGRFLRNWIFTYAFAQPAKAYRANLILN